MIAQDVISRALDTMQDPAGTRWPQVELLRFLTDGETEVVVRRPQAYVKRPNVPVVVGTTVQSLPADAITLIRVTHNVLLDGTPSTALSKVDLDYMDRAVPTWHADAPATPTQYMYNPLDPKVFFLYPRPALPGSVGVVYSAAPPPLTGANDVLVLDDSYLSPLLDYLLFRVFSKNASHAGQASRAKDHWGAFNLAVPSRTAVEQTVQPTADSQG